MKRIRILVCLLCCMIAAGVFVAVTCTAGEQPEITVNVRIEGISQNLYYGDITVGVGSTVQDAILALDKREADITINGADAGYITAVNSDGSGLTEQGWDGWLVRVNGQALASGIGSVSLENGDSIVLYYSDEYGTGMQYPDMDASDIENGKLKFTSKDTTYDENYNPTVKENPVAGMTVRWYVGETANEYITDESGYINIDKDKLTAGKHKIEVERSANGIPTVLRLSPDTAVEIADKSPLSTDESGTKAPDTEIKGGCRSAVFVGAFPILGIVMLAGAVTLKKRK